MLRSPLLQISLSFAFLLGLSGCSSKPPEVSEAAKQAHIEVVRETAIGYATQYALHWEAKYINEHLDARSRQLDAVYDFRQLLLENSVVPPILEESRQNVSYGNYKTIRVSDRLIKIVKPAGFSTVAPTWRDYVYLKFPMPDEPNNRLWPKNDSERAAWDEGLVEGWKVGRWQASSIFQSNLGLLQRDFNGMVLYHNLLSQNMISPTHSAVANLGVTGNGQEMQLNDRVVKITSESALQPHDVDHWKAAIQKVYEKTEVSRAPDEKALTPVDEEPLVITK